MKHAVFYCQNCKKPVPLEARACPHCGSEFTAVQCPRCSFVGTAALFRDGCPECGYLSPAHRGARQAPASPTPVRAAASGRPAPGGAAARTRAAASPRGHRVKVGRGLPGWFYGVASVILAIVVVALLVVLLRLR